MKKGSITFITIASIVVCASLQIFVAHRLSTAGIELTQMENEIRVLGEENEELRHKIASGSSLMAISQKASELGFETASFYYVQKPPIALVQ